jgi:hypothetical protein
MRRSFHARAKPLGSDLSRRWIPRIPKPTKRVFVPIEDANLARFLEASEATGETVVDLIRSAVSKFFDGQCEKR